MVTEYMVETLLQPVRLELERAHGLDADWVIIVDEDRRGIQLIEVRLDIQRDAKLTVDDVQAIRARIQECLSENEDTAPYFPFVMFNVTSIKSFS